MKNFYGFYKLADVKMQRCVALLLWRHNILILSKIKSLKEAYKLEKINSEGKKK